MQITIKWNEKLGEARLTPQSKKMILEGLKKGSETGVIDLPLADFLEDCKFITENAYYACASHEADFKETI